MLALLERTSARVTRVIALAGLVGLVGVALATIVDVMMRWLFNSPIDGVTDVSKLVVAIVIASFFPAALAERHHISITFLGSGLGPRAAAWLEVFASLSTAAFATVVGWQFWLFTAELYDSGETTWLLGWEVAPWWTATTMFMVLCVPIQFVVFLANVGVAFRGEPPHGGHGITPEDGSPASGDI